MAMRSWIARRLRESIQREDIALVLWVLLVEPLIARLLGLRDGSIAGTAGGPIVGLLYLGSVLAAAGCLLTRPTDGDAESVRSLDTRLAFTGPFLMGITLVLVAAFDAIGFGSAEPLIGIFFVVGFGAAVLHERLPRAPAATRRLLIAPYVIAAAALFDSSVGVVREILDPRALVAADPTGESGLLGLLLFAAISFSLLYYAALIVAPRELADPQRRRWPWVVRYVVFIAATMAGAYLGGGSGRA